MEMVLNRGAPSPLRAADEHSRGWGKARISWSWTNEGSVSTVWGGGTHQQALFPLCSDVECAIAHGQTNGWLSLWHAPSYKNIYDNLKNQIMTPKCQSFPTKTKRILVLPPLKRHLTVLSKLSCFSNCMKLTLLCDNWIFLYTFWGLLIAIRTHVYAQNIFCP